MKCLGKVSTCVWVSLLGIDGAVAQEREGAAERRGAGVSDAQLELQQRRAQRIAEERTAGRMGPLEAECRALLNRHSDHADPAEHQRAIRVWRTEKGDALEAELRAKRAAEQARIETSLAELRARREARLSQEVAAGRMSRLEAEFRELMQREGEDPELHQAEIRAWLKSEKGEALRVERARSQALRQQQRDAEMAELRAHRQRRIDEEVAAGRMGRLEGEYRTLLNGDYANEEARQEAIRAWEEVKGAALEAERTLRSESK